jgi:hypothetical protein
MTAHALIPEIDHQRIAALKADTERLLARFGEPFAIAREVFIPRRRAHLLRIALLRLAGFARGLVCAMAERLLPRVQLAPVRPAAARASWGPRRFDISDADSARWTGAVFRFVVARRDFPAGLVTRRRRRGPAAAAPLALRLEALRRVALDPERCARRLARRLAAQRRSRVRRIRDWRRRARWGQPLPPPRGAPRRRRPLARARWLDTG